jgi:hypothetical protein
MLTASHSTECGAILLYLVCLVIKHNQLIHFTLLIEVYVTTAQNRTEVIKWSRRRYVQGNRFGGQNGIVSP